MAGSRNLGKLPHLVLAAGLTASLVGCGGGLNSGPVFAPIPATAAAPSVAVNTKATLALLETTDLHTLIRNSSSRKNDNFQMLPHP